MKFIDLAALTVFLTATNAQYQDVSATCQQLGYNQNQDALQFYSCQLNLATFNQQYNAANGFQPGQPGYVEPQLPSGPAPTTVAPTATSAAPTSAESASSDASATPSASSTASASESSGATTSATESSASATETTSATETASTTTSDSTSATSGASTTTASSSTTTSQGSDANMVAGSFLFATFGLIASLLV